jgi:hypothetical protein
MEVNGQVELLTVVALPLRKHPTVTIEQEAGGIISVCW